MSLSFSLIWCDSSWFAFYTNSLLQSDITTRLHLFRVCSLWDWRFKSLWQISLEFTRHTFLNWVEHILFSINSIKKMNKCYMNAIFSQSQLVKTTFLSCAFYMLLESQGMRFNAIEYVLLLILFALRPHLFQSTLVKIIIRKNSFRPVITWIQPLYFEDTFKVIFTHTAQ